jgi:tetrahydromethanopterin S-methyltransferase subunit H
VLVATHTEGAGVFSPGAAASTNIRTLAEGGDSSALQAELAGTGAETTIINGVNANEIGPGESVTFNSFMSSAGNDRLTVLTKIMPTNDAFAALNSIEIPTDPGRHVFKLDTYDAGTEANDELIVSNGETVGVPGIVNDPNVMNLGVSGTGASNADSNTMIHIHRGVLGDDNNSGGASDLDVSTHRWLNPVVRVIIDVN